MVQFWLRHGERKDFESLFLAHLELIERTARSVARRHGYEQEDTEDFSSHVKTKLLDDDYAVFRKFQGRCQLDLYLKTVIHRLYIDYEIAQKGKWRPSATAQKMGTIAVQLEELLYRKHHTFEEAYQILNSRLGMELDRNALSEIVQKLPKRWGKTTVKFLSLDASPIAEPVTETEAQDPKTIERAQLLAVVIKAFIGRLTGAERLILKMRFHDDFTFEEIARFVKKKKMQVYWQLRRVLADLQEELLAHGLSGTVVREILEQEGKKIDIDFVMRNETEQS